MAAAEAAGGGSGKMHPPQSTLGSAAGWRPDGGGGLTGGKQNKKGKHGHWGHFAQTNEASFHGAEK